MRTQLPKNKYVDSTQQEPGGHDVVVVYDFNEGLNFASLLDLALRHGLDNLSGVSIDASNCTKALLATGL